jgi:hypothetical protein
MASAAGQKQQGSDRANVFRLVPESRRNTFLAVPARKTASIDLKCFCQFEASSCQSDAQAAQPEQSSGDEVSRLENKQLVEEEQLAGRGIRHSISLNQFNVFPSEDRSARAGDRNPKGTHIEPCRGALYRLLPRSCQITRGHAGRSKR